MLYAGSYCSQLRIRSGNSIFVIQIMFGPCRDYFWSLFSLPVTSMDPFWRAAWDSIFRPLATEPAGETGLYRGHHRDIRVIYTRERYSQFILQSRVKFDWGSCHVSHACHVAGRGPRVSSLECEPSNNWVSSAGDSSPLDDERDIRRQPAKEC
mgnify:CR=1 FL=1